MSGPAFCRLLFISGHCRSVNRNLGMEKLQCTFWRPVSECISGNRYSRGQQEVTVRKCGSVKKAVQQIAACAGILILVCLVCRVAFFRGYTAYVPFPEWQREGLRLEKTELDHPEVMTIGDMEMQGNYLRMTVNPVSRGDATVDFRDGSGEPVRIHILRVGPFQTVYDLQTGGFTGDTMILIAVTLFWISVSAIMIWHYLQAKGPSYYAYSTIYFAGFSLFSLVNSIVMLQITIRHMVSPMEFSMFSAYETINGASRLFMTVTMPPMVVFAIAMGISNVVLLRHERARMKNTLGLAVSIALILGEVLGMYLFTRDFMGSEWEGRIRNTMENVYATVFVYFECMLVGSVICGITAARHMPAMQSDFIVILGCWFRRDGTLPPLLKGRVDRAIDFWQKQKETTGKEALFIPSGGQGADEPMPEAEAMKRYLVSQQVPETLIRVEDKSLNTFQNMTFSRKIMEEINPEGTAVFATTNYHVFRSGVWASLAGLRIEGMGSRTRWWYWPNAFMRECVGLLANRWKQELVLLLALIVFFGVLSIVL